MGGVGPVTSVGPWRQTLDKAKEDGAIMDAAYSEGGDAAVQKVKRQLHINSKEVSEPSQGVVNDGDGVGEGEGRATEVFAGGGVSRNSDGRYSWPAEIEGPSQSSSSLGGYRAACTFPSGKSLSYDAGKRRKPITVKGPWRVAAGAKVAAEADAAALCGAFDAGGNEAMQEKKAELFRFAEEQAKSAKLARKKSTSHDFVPAAGGAADREPAIGSVAPSVSSTRHSVARDEASPTKSQHAEPGIAASAARNRFEAPAGAPSQPIIINEDDMANRYGKGFSMLTGMGFKAGGGLGREGQGRAVPVEAASAKSVAATSGRKIGLGFSHLPAGSGSP